MISNPFKSLLAAVIILAGASPASAVVTNVVDWNSSWRYDQRGALPAANWMATNYDDSTWPTGTGALGFPVGENLLGLVGVNTTLNINTNGAQIITYYFRTRFVLSTTNNVTLTTSNLIDDGAVFYLNGREIQRVAMGTTNITYSSVATRGDEVSARGADTFAIAITNAVVGTNVLAVEVHQNSASGSSDLILASKVIANVPQPPVITTQPQDVTVDAGQVAMFNVSVLGDPTLVYRWYSNNVAIPNGTAATYTTPATTLAMNGINYYVVVSNLLGRATSSVATLTVEFDDNGPLMIDALPQVGTSNQIVVRFNEQVTAASATNRNNWLVHVLGTTNTIGISNVIYGATQMRLTLSNSFSPNSNYVVCAYNMRDTKVNSVNITPSDCVGLTFLVTTNVLFFEQLWDLSAGIPPATNWTQPNYVLEEFWGSGEALFANDQSAGFMPCGSRDAPFVLPNGPNTFYFRKLFAMTSTLAPTVTLNIQHVVDDGAVFYLNGTEILRYNMPPGPVVDSTPALSRVDNATCISVSAQVPGSLLRIGSDNVLAVRVHNWSDEGFTENDSAFDMELSMSYRRTPEIPNLNITRTYTTNLQGVITATNIVVTWVGTGWVLQHSTNGVASWGNLSTSVVQGTNRYQTTLATQGPRRFYRLKNP
jgi:hypothetical protein